jgi:hypothetical protein
VQSFNSAKEEEDNGDNGEAREVAAVTATSDDGIKFSEVAAPPEIGDARAATEEVAWKRNRHDISTGTDANDKEEEGAEGVEEEEEDEAGEGDDAVEPDEVNIQSKWHWMNRLARAATADGENVNNARDTRYTRGGPPSHPSTCSFFPDVDAPSDESPWPPTDVSSPVTITFSSSSSFS